MLLAQDWRTLWVDEAFWHLLFAVDLLLVMFVCRPTTQHYRSVTHDPALQVGHIQLHTHIEVCTDGGNIARKPR